MYSRLIEDHMWELRQIVLDVLDAVAADDILPPLVMRFPEGRLADPIAFLQHAFTKLKPNAWNISIVRQWMPSA